MSEFRHAAEVLRNQAKKTEALTRAAAALERIADLESYAAEKERLLAEVSAKQENAARELEAVRGQISEAKASAETVLAEANANAAGIIAGAKATAKADGERLVASARAEAQATHERKAQLDAEATTVKASLDAMRKELVDVEKRLAAAKESVRSLLAQGAS